MDFDQRWDCIQRWRLSENRSFNIGNSIKLIDSSKRKEYTLVQKISKDSHVYKAVDGSGEVYHLKVIHCASHSALKQYAKSIRVIQKLPYTQGVVQIFDHFPVCQKGRWALIILSKFIDAVSLEEWIRFRTSWSIGDRPLLKVKTEAMIYAFIDLINILKFFHDRDISLGALNPKNVLIEKVNHRVPGAFHYHDNSSFLIKISPTSSENFGLPVRYPHLKLEDWNNGREFDNDIWGLGNIVYAIITDTPSSEIPNFSTTSLEARDKFFSQIEDSIGRVLSALYDDSQCRRAGDLLSNSIIKIWSMIKNREDLDTNDPDVLPGLVLGLKFEDPAVSVKCFEAILRYAIEFRVIAYDYLIGESITNVFLRSAASYQDWSKNSQILNIFLEILYSRLDNPNFKDKIMRFGVLEILKKIQYNSKDVNINLIFDIFYKFSIGNTLTILQIAQELDLLKMAESQRSISTHAKNFMYTVPYYGPSSVNFIKELWCRRVIDSEIKLLQKLYEVPAFFKVDHFAIALFIIDEVLKNIGRAHTKEVFLNTIRFVICNMGELLCMPRLLTYLSCIGECTNHYIQNNKNKCYQGKNPLIAMCKQCNIAVCNPCAAYKHAGHAIEYCHYQSPHNECACIDCHELPSINLEEIQLPKISDGVNLVDSRGKRFTLYRVNHLKVIRPQCTNVLKTVESLESELPTGMRCYYEVKVISAGFYEDIILSYENTGVEYHGKDGKIYKNGVEFFQGPRFGSYDFVGLGLTRNHAIVTYNGLLLHPLVPITLPNEIRPHVTLNGENTSINFNLSREVKFKPPERLEDLDAMFDKAHVDESRHILKKLGKKVFESSKAMNRKEFRERVEEIRSKAAELLIHLNKREELDRLQRKDRDCVIF